LSDVERSVILWSVFAIGSTLTYGFSGGPGMCHFSTAVLQVANAGVRRPGYQATELAVLMYSL